MKFSYARLALGRGTAFVTQLAIFSHPSRLRLALTVSSVRPSQCPPPQSLVCSPAVESS